MNSNSVEIKSWLLKSGKKWEMFAGNFLQMIEFAGKLSEKEGIDQFDIYCDSLLVGYVEVQQCFTVLLSKDFSEKYTVTLSGKVTVTKKYK